MTAMLLLRENFLRLVVDRNEFEKVYMEVFSNNPALQSHAVGRLAVWKCR